MLGFLYMPSITHRIADITFRTDSTFPLFRLQRENYAKFRVPANTIPDVKQRFHRVSASLLSEVQKKLRAANAGQGQTHFHVEPDHIAIYDYTRREMDFLYSGSYGGPHEWDIEKHLSITDDSPAAGRFFMYQVKRRDLTAPPLTEREQDRLSQIAEFSPRLIPSMPLLRSPAVRAALQPGMDGIETIKVYIYLGGLSVWNRSKNTVTFFYLEGQEKLRRSPESRLEVELRWLFAMFLPCFSAIMVHASGVIRNGRAAVFLAPDAGGKTTVLEQSPQGLFLSDDQIILRREQARFTAHATPFGAMSSGSCQAPLGALFLLEKAPFFEVQPAKPAEVIAAYWPDPENSARRLPKPYKVRAFDLFYDACHQVPTYRMRFPKDFVDWAAIDAAMA